MSDEVLSGMRMVPRWGTPVVHVLWSPRRGVESLQMQLQRSYGPDEDWVNVSAVPVRGLCSDDDTTLSQGYDLAMPQYRVKVIDNDGYVAYSSAYRMYSHVPRSALLLARCLANREHQYMRADKTPEVLVLHKIVIGDPCVCKDTNSGMTVGTSSCPYCYGTGTYGGYWRPYRVLCKFLAPESLNVKAVQDASDYATDNKQKVRMFGVADMKVGDLIVVPTTDERYTVIQGSTDQIMGYLPAATELDLKRLDPSDIRQKIPVNDL